MSEQKYAFEKYDRDNMARSIAKDLSISTKKTVEICSFIRGKSVSRARAMLSRVLNKKDAVPYKRFNQELAHNQRGPSGYPIKAIQEVLNLLDNVEANANSKGLHTDSLKIVHMLANRAGKRMHYGRLRRREMKRTHLEIIVKDVSGKAKKKTGKDSKKKETASQDDKKEKASTKTDVKTTETKKETEKPVKEENKEKTESQPKSQKAEKKTAEKKQPEKKAQKSDDKK